FPNQGKLFLNPVGDDVVLILQVAYEIIPNRFRKRLIPKVWVNAAKIQCESFSTILGQTISKLLGRLFPNYLGHYSRITRQIVWKQKVPRLYGKRLPNYIDASSLC
ncbi:MAG: hypothetical protein ACKPKO_64590, partial [Candidatus Fonsibacter sp.]